MGRSNHISLTCTLLLLCLVCCKQTKYSNDDSDAYRDSLDLGYRFFIDTITIKEPLLAIYNDELYLMDGKYAESFTENPHLKDGLKMFHILPHNIRQDVMTLFGPSNKSVFTERAMEQLHLAHWGYLGEWTNTLFFKKKEGQVEFYGFRYIPARFLLELVWVDPERYRDHPYGPGWLFIVQERDIDDLDRYPSKLDSLESVPIKPKDSEKAHYVLTVEPLFSRTTVNQSIKDFAKEHSYYGPLIPKRTAKKYCFPDLL